MVQGFHFEERNQVNALGTATEGQPRRRRVSKTHARASQGTCSSPCWPDSQVINRRVGLAHLRHWILPGQNLLVQRKEAG